MNCRQLLKAIATGAASAALGHLPKALGGPVEDMGGWDVRPRWGHGIGGSADHRWTLKGLLKHCAGMGEPEASAVVTSWAAELSDE